jgi:Domain of unknown function (DUF4132)
VEDAAKQALAIYETICATSADRPFAFHSADQMRQEIAAWRAANAGLVRLRQASPEVQTAFLGQSVEWLKSESREHSNFRVTSTLVEAIQHAIQAAPKPLATELVLSLLTELRKNTITRFYFPFDLLLSILTREQVTEEIRSELRQLHLQYAPSPTGKIEERTLQTRNRLAELMRAKGEAQRDPRRGPWSQIVFTEIAGKDDITRAGWEGLLEHCRALEQTVPGTKWRKRSHELASALGESEVWRTLERWLALGPTPGQPAGARSPIEDSSYQKGVVWCAALSRRPEMASTIGDFAIACLRKIPMLGAVSQKVGFAGVQALGAMESNEAVSQLARLRAKVKYTVALRLIEKCLHEAAERTGLTVDELEDLAAPSYPLDAEGKTGITVGDCAATVRLWEDGEAVVIWRNAEGKLLKTAPSHIKKAFPKEVKSVAALAKELGEAYLAQRYRLESSFIATRSMSTAHWRHYFIDHSLLGLIGRGLIWVFSIEQGWERSGLYGKAEVRDSRGATLDVGAATKVRLWHPLSSEASELQQWRDRVFNERVRQPFRQAFREFYQLTDGERQTRMYSNRFAGVVMRQHQFSSLCRARGWSYRLMGAGFDGFNVPTKMLPSWNMHVEFYVDLPSDRKPSLRESALGEQSQSGINLFLGSDQVRFYRDRKEIALDEVPAIVYSEVMRDIDLFTSVSAVGPDESWFDQGDRGMGILPSAMNMNEVSELLALRLDILSRVLPLTDIADRCKVDNAWIVVQGQLGTYRVEVSSGLALRVSDSGVRHLTIPQKLLDQARLDFSAIPIELDYRTEMILRKACVLANDWNIDSPELIRQLM